MKHKKLSQESKNDILTVSECGVQFLPEMIPTGVTVSRKYPIFTAKQQSWDNTGLIDASPRDWI